MPLPTQFFRFHSNYSTLVDVYIAEEIGSITNFQVPKRRTIIPGSILQNSKKMARWRLVKNQTISTDFKRFS